MTPINFNVLQAEYPEYASAWPALREWFKRHGQQQHVEFMDLLRGVLTTNGKVNELDAILAIHAMVDRGMLALAYRVKSPSGELLEGDFDRPDRIPLELLKKNQTSDIKTTNADIVSVYRWESTDAA